MSYGAEAPTPQRESSYKWKRLSPESQHVETDREHQASRAAPTGQPLVSNHSPLRPVAEYIIHCYRCLQYRIDKAIDTLETHHKHKHTECIALNVRVMDKP